MISVWWDNLKESCDTRALVGMGSMVGWLLLLAISPVFSDVPTLIDQGVSWRVMVVVLLLVWFVVVAALSLTSIQPSRLVRPVVGAVLSGAAAFFGVIIHRFASGFAADVFSACIMAGALCVLGLLWAQSFSHMSLRKRVVATVAASIFGCVLYLVIVVIPQPFALFVGACLPAASSVLFVLFNASKGERDAGEDANVCLESLTEKKGPQESEVVVTKGEGGSVHLFRSFGRELSVSIALYGMLFVLAGHVLPEIEAQWVASVVPGVINVAAFLAIESVLTVYMVKRVRRENPVVAYRPAALLVAIAFLLLPFASEDWSMVLMATAFAGFGSFMVFLWIVMGNICQKWSLPPFGVFSQGFCILLVGMLAGELCSWLLVSFSHGGSFEYVATISIVSLFLLVVMMWQMSDGSRFANETKEMGGAFFDRSIDAHSEDAADELSTLRYVAE
ncbi:MAG: hypothetical protein RR672_09690, partial [Raoultibacter sp.]